MTVNQPGRGRAAALSEALRQLLDARQEKLAERLIDQCSSELIRQISETPVATLHARLSYLLRTRLRRHSPPGERGVHSAAPLLVGVFNVWCREGRRASVRSVLRELGGADLRALRDERELDPEVVSMLHEFESRA